MFRYTFGCGVCVFALIDDDNFDDFDCVDCCNSPCTCIRVFTTSIGFVNKHAHIVALPPNMNSVKTFRFLIVAVVDV
jgi:hypothetical protein